MAYLGSTPQTQSFIAATDIFIVGATAQTIFQLSRTVTTVNDVSVQVGNTAMFPPASGFYSVAGSQLTLSTGVSNVTVYVRYLSTTTYQLVPGVGTVGISQLSASGSPSNANFLRGDNTWTAITLSSITGTLAITQGGTGQTTQQTAINALVGNVVSGGLFLRGNGTNVSMSAIVANDLPANITANTTGTAANVTGIVAIVNGGTGANTVPTAQSALQLGTTNDVTHNSLSTTANVSAGTSLSAGTTVTAGTTVSDAKGELRTIPANVQGASYTLVASDSGKFISIAAGGVTVPASVFTSGQAVTIWNNSGSSQTITQGGSVTMYNAADGSTGNRTLAGRGVATVLCVGTNIFAITGGGLT
jgi:hypothetical protein